MPRRFQYRIEEEAPEAPLPVDIVSVSGWEQTIEDWVEQQHRMEQEGRRFGDVDRAVTWTAVTTLPLKKKPEVLPKWERPNILETLSPYEKVRLKTAAHSILSPIGVEEVRHFMRRRYDIGWTYTNVVEYLGLEQNIQSFILTIGREENKIGGKFINRFAKALYLLYNQAVSERDKAELNKIIESHWVGGESYWIDRPSIVDWDVGAFGEKKSERGSCWWYDGGLESSDSPISRFNNRMLDGLTGAIRLWLRDGEDFQGVGRVWYIRTRSGFPLLFNGYGLTTPQWAAKLSRHFEVERYKSIALRIDPEMVINNNTGIAFDYLPEELKTAYRFHLSHDLD